MRLKDDDIKKQVRDRYAQAAASEASCCAPSSPCGCGRPEATGESASRRVGYSPEELKSVPEQADLGLGCGNPSALAGLKTGEVVLDLGSGAGLDCFLAAGQVGGTGRVIGVDMTPAMIDRARENARKGGYGNVEFRLGEIENLPAADGSIDVIISNCVINLSTDKARVFREAFRVLRPGGRLMVSDLALRRPLPPAIRESVDVYVACVGGALVKDDYLAAVRAAGFENIDIVRESAFPAELVFDDPRAPELMKKMGLTREELTEHVSLVLSLSIRAVKPAASRAAR